MLRVSISPEAYQNLAEPKTAQANLDNIYLPGRDASGAAKTALPRRSCCESGLSKTSVYRSGPYESCQDGSFQNESIAHSSPQRHPATGAAPLWPPLDHFPEINCSKSGPTTTSINGSGPQPRLSKRTASQKKLLPKRARANNIQLQGRAY